MNKIDVFEDMTVQELAAVEGGKCTPVFYGANGYGCQDSKTHHWRYLVTKNANGATSDVIVNGWVSSAAGGYFAKT